MTSKTALVTGGTAGIGLSLVRELVRNDFFVYFIGTSREKGARVESELNGAHDGVHDPVCKFVQLDLSDLKAVRALTDQLKSDVSQLDILLNVAGVLLPKRQETAEGFEKTFTIGYLSAFLLARELTPLLEKVSHSRILNVAGAPSHLLKRRLNFDDLSAERSYSGIRAALDTVHAKTVLTEMLAERLKEKNIDVNSFHPGGVKSDLGRNFPFLLRPIFNVANVFMSNTSTSGVYVSTSDEVKGVTGQFFVKTTATPLSFGDAYKEQLWSVTETMVETALS